MALGACTTLSSCWFNSAGYIFDSASYKAKSDTADLKVGSPVFYKDGSYYIELPRYKTGTEQKHLYVLGEQSSKKERCTPAGTQTFRIPNYYAEYLIGRSKNASAPSSLTPVSDSFRQGSDSTFTVVNTPGTTVTNYSYSSPAAAWLYTAGVLDVICVDVAAGKKLTGE